jgi:hypothetical protein
MSDILLSFKSRLIELAYSNVAAQFEAVC